MSLPLTSLTPEVFRQLYEVEKKTEREIAELYGTYQVRVCRLRRQFGISTLSKNDRLDLPKELGPQLRSILIGSMLGDGGLRLTGSYTAGYVEHHSAAQREYLEWKVGVWGPFVSSVIPSDKDCHKGFRMLTHGCRVLYPFWQMFYPTGKGDKTYTEMPIDLVDSLALAVWFMDDGSAGKESFRFSIGPSEIDREVKLRVLRRLGLKGHYYQSNTDHSIHIFGRTDLTKFIDLVQPYIHPSLAYKMEIVTRKRGPAPRDILTPDRLNSLVGRGFTAQAIASTFSVSTQSVCRALDRIGVKRRVGRPPKNVRQEMDLELATIAIERLDSSSGSFLEDVLNVLSRTVLPIVAPTEEDVLKDWERIRAATTRLEGDTLVGVSSAGSKVCQKFFSYRLDARYRNLPSVREAWYDSKFLRRAIKFQLAVGDPVFPARVFRALQAVVRGPTNFRPCFAKALVEALCPEGGVVIDPCSGYGGRAVGVLASGRKYIGVDPHPKAKEAYRELQRVVGGLSFHNQPYEDVDLGPAMADMVFTSPPYFSVERYSDDPTQSWVRYNTWESWVKGFLQPFVIKSKAYLKSGGVFCVNTKNVRSGRQVFPIADMLTDLAQEVGFKLKTIITLPLGHIGKALQTEPVFVFEV